MVSAQGQYQRWDSDISFPNFTDPGGPDLYLQKENTWSFLVTGALVALAGIVCGLLPFLPLGIGGHQGKEIIAEISRQRLWVVAAMEEVPAAEAVSLQQPGCHPVHLELGQCGAGRCCRDAR